MPMSGMIDERRGDRVRAVDHRRPRRAPRTARAATRSTAASRRGARPRREAPLAARGREGSSLRHRAARPATSVCPRCIARRYGVCRPRPTFGETPRSSRSVTCGGQAVGRRGLDRRAPLRPRRRLRRRLVERGGEAAHLLRRRRRRAVRELAAQVHGRHRRDAPRRSSRASPATRRARSRRPGWSARMPPSASSSTTRGSTCSPAPSCRGSHAAHDGRIAAWTLVEPARPTGPRSARRASDRRRRRRPALAAAPRAASSAHQRFERDDRLVVPREQPLGEPEPGERLDTAVGVDGDAEHRRPGKLGASDQPGDRRAERARRAEGGLLAAVDRGAGRRVPDRRARPCRRRRRRRSATRARGRRAPGGGTGSECRGAGRELAVHLQLVGLAERAGRRATRRSGGGGRPGSPRASRRRRRRARWRCASRSAFGVSGPATSAVHRSAVCRVDQLNSTGMPGVRQQRQAVRDLRPHRLRDRGQRVGEPGTGAGGLDRQDRLDPVERPGDRRQSGVQFVRSSSGRRLRRRRSPRDAGAATPAGCSMFSGVMRHMSAASPDTKFMTRLRRVAVDLHDHDVPRLARRCPASARAARRNRP